jgi:wobble nucleotide-excising tRNase
MDDKKIRELEDKIKNQQKEIDKLTKRSRRHKWLIFSLLCDK